MGSILATADIGSNTAHLLVGSVQVESSTSSAARNDRMPNVLRLDNESIWISLGESVGRYGMIPSNLQQLLIRTLSGFRDCAARADAESIYVFGTEALRKAANSSEVIDAIWERTRIEVDIIAPAREAQLSLFGVQAEHPLPQNFILLEVGGGSAQVAVCKNNQILDDYSLPIGTGTLVAISNLQQPSTSKQLALVKRELDRFCSKLPRFDNSKFVVASGGVARGLWRSLHPDGERKIELFELQYVVESCKNLTTEQIVRRFSVKERRAATLLPGALCYIHLLEALGVTSMSISEFGVREGALIELARGDVRGSLL